MWWQNPYFYSWSSVLPNLSVVFLVHMTDTVNSSLNCLLVTCSAGEIEWYVCVRACMRVFFLITGINKSYQIEHDSPISSVHIFMLRNQVPLPDVSACEYIVTSLGLCVCCKLMKENYYKRSASRGIGSSKNAFWKSFVLFVNLVTFVLSLMEHSCSAVMIGYDSSQYIANKCACDLILGLNPSTRCLHNSFPFLLIFASFVFICTFFITIFFHKKRLIMKTAVLRLNYSVSTSLY